MLRGVKRQKSKKEINGKPIKIKRKSRTPVKRFTRLIEFTEKEKISFEFLQKMLSNAIFFYHFDRNRQLYENVDVFKKRDFETFFYHVKSDPDPARVADILKRDIQSILFFNKIFINAEKYYWPIELEVADIV
jgi:hypothetical protein